MTPGQVGAIQAHRAIGHQPRAGAEEQALLAVEEEYRLKIKDLVARAGTIHDPAQLQSLGVQVEEMKRQGQAMFLRTKARFARSRADLAAAHEIESQIDPIVNPTKVKVGNTDTAQRPAPDPTMNGSMSGFLYNLNATITPGGFDSPAVPRNAPDASYGNAVVPATLVGNVNNTYFNWAIQQEGPDPAPAWVTQLWVDETELGYFGGIPDNNPPTSYQAINVGPATVRGGRHSLTTYADRESVVIETNESDNVWRGQWVWSPLVLAREVPVVRSAPPPRGVLTLPNSDGMSFLRPASFAWVVSLAARNPTDDYDLFVHDSYTNSTSGFDAIIQTSTQSGDGTDFVVGHFSGTPVVVYSAGVRFSIAGGGGEFVADQSDGLGRNSTGAGRWTGQDLGINRLTNVYEAHLEMGITYYLKLRKSGIADIAFYVYDPAAGGIHNRGSAAAVSSSASANLDTLVFIPSATGWHPIVVFKPQGRESHHPVVYDFSIDTNPLVDAPNNMALPDELVFTGATPNPMRESSRFSFAQPTGGRVRLSVFDLHGRRVRMLVDGDLDAGNHFATWNARRDDGQPVGSGVFLARLEAQGRTLTRRVTVIR